MTTDRPHPSALSAAIRDVCAKLERLSGTTTSDAPVEAEPPDGDTSLVGFEHLCRVFGLYPFEREILLLCLAWELDTRMPALCAAAQANPRKSFPTFALALALSDDPLWDALSPERPLRKLHIIELSPSEQDPLLAWPLRLDERVLGFIKGVHHLDARWSTLAELEGVLPRALPASQEQLVLRICERIKARPAGRALPLVQLFGRDEALARTIAARCAAAFGLPLYRVSAAALPTQIGELDLLLRLWQREVSLSGAALYLELAEGTEPLPSTVARFCERVAGVGFVHARQKQPLSERQVHSYELVPAALSERRAAWVTHAPWLDDAWSARLATQFALDDAGIRSAIESCGPDTCDAEALWRSAHDVCLPALDGLARRIEPAASWEDLVLPDEELRQLHELANQASQRFLVYEEWGFGARVQRGLALTALFAGESGTGKTLAAEVLAHALRVPLLCIDLSAVVDKYIGQTEKNLRRVFDSAEDAGALLFFDEADALFGKRSEVRDSHDRFANIEINYLLQRMEAYRGLAVLATNMKGALDAAFMRRLRFHVRFSFPGPAERRTMWQRVFPARAPVGELDLERLASFSLTGSSIRNAAVNAAFLAASDGGTVMMRHVLTAIRLELRKLDQRCDEARFLEHVPRAVQQGRSR